MTALSSSSAAATILIVFPWCLDRVGHGNTQRVLAMARFLSLRGVVVDLVYQGNPSVPPADEHYPHFRRVIRVDSWRSSYDDALTRELQGFYHGYEPAPASFWPGTAFTAAVRGLLDAVDYTAVISSYAWTAPIFEPLARRALRIVDLHDVISLHAARGRAATGVTPPFSFDEATERFLWRKWDVLLAISQEEAALVADAIRPTQRLLTVGHAAEVLPVTPSEDNSIVYTASDNRTNQLAVEWLIRDVWPLVHAERPDAHLRVVGLICNSLRKTQWASTPGVELAGFADDVSRELTRGSIVVAPYPYGSGLKIKVLEAAAAGRPLVTTTPGIEGTGLEANTHVLVADTAAEFARAVIALLDQPVLRASLADAAQRHVRRTFSPDVCYGPLLELILQVGERAVPLGAIPEVVEQRLRTALAAHPESGVVVWGNGSHTRQLVPVLASFGVRARAVVDKSARTPGVSIEGIQVLPPDEYRPLPSDLVVLSSQAFEEDMWTDLEPLRASGLQVMSLYRLDLVTDGVEMVLQPRTGLDARRSIRRGRTTQSRLFIAEPSAGRSRGPFLRFARSLASSERVQVVVAGARKPTIEGMEPEDVKILEPTFEFSCWDMLREYDQDFWRIAARYARFSATDLAALAARHTITGGDTVLFHTANIVDVMAAGTWVNGMPSGSIPTLSLLFHFTPSQEAQWLKKSVSDVHSAYALALAQLEERAGPVQIFAQTDTLAPVLTDAFGRDVRSIGFPVVRTDSFHRRLNGARLRILFAGEARAEKGFGLLPEIADVLEQDLASGRAQLVCQVSENEFADDHVKSTIRALAERPGVELIDRFVPSHEYDALIAGCDVVLLPYEPSRYRTRLSAVFVDATSAGVPVIVPDGTWMSQQLAEGRGAGVTFDALTSLSVGDAVRRVLDLPSLKLDAQAAMARVWQRHNPETVLTTIMGRALDTAAATSTYVSAA